MTISLIIPIYNEARHLEAFLKQLDTLALSLPKELIFVDDCSSDDSLKILNSYNFASNFKIFHQECNQGKGAALQRGILEATGDFIGIQDADFEYRMSDINSLLQPLINDEADVVYGSRFHKNNHQVHRTFHYLINRFLTLCSNLMSGLYLSDMETCYKFFKAEILINIKLESKAFGFEPEITAKLGKLKVRVMELPISYYPRNYLEGKKISWKDGFAALKHIAYFNLFVSKNDCLRAGLPKSYIPLDKNLL